MQNNNRGSASSNQEQQRGDTSNTGQNRNTNSGNFANDPQRASEAGRKGGEK